MSPLLEQELRGGWLGVPHRYHALDFLGIALGAYFIWAGATGRAPRWSLAALGGIMVYIHAQRFFFAPQSREGLIRLLDELRITPEEIASLRYNGNGNSAIAPTAGYPVIAPVRFFPDYCY
jgi:hypothetical protein